MNEQAWGDTSFMVGASLAGALGGDGWAFWPYVNAYGVRP